MKWHQYLKCFQWTFDQKNESNLIIYCCFILYLGKSSLHPNLPLPQISKQHLQTVKERFQAFLSGDTQIVADEAFINAVQSYYDVSGTQNNTELYYTEMAVLIIIRAGQVNALVTR